MLRLNKLKHILITAFYTITLFSLPMPAQAKSPTEQQTDSLLRVLDTAIANRATSQARHNEQILQMRAKCDRLTDPRKKIAANFDIAESYSYFKSDSAKVILRRNLKMAREMGDSILVAETLLHMAMTYAICGEFVACSYIFNQYDFEDLPIHMRAYHCYARIRYYEHLCKTTSEEALTEVFNSQKMAWREKLIEMLGDGSDLQHNEKLAQLIEQGRYNEALPKIKDVLNSLKPGTREYGMRCMALAQVYALQGNTSQQKRYLTEAAIIDANLGITENQALLQLAELLYAEGNIKRAYTYMQAAFNDANFYNSQFKNALVANVFPVVEEAYMKEMHSRQGREHIIMVITLALVLITIFVALAFYHQKKDIDRAHKATDEAKRRLERANSKLLESTIIKEQYVGYFMQQCSVYINRLDEFRRNVNRKIKAKKFEDAYVMSSRPMEKELEGLYTNFDSAFLNLYPNFMEEFNKLLAPEGQFHIDDDKHLNPTLRVFALMRLGITDMRQIANFLNYTVQTIYNYKSRVKKYSLLPEDEFDKRVRSIGTINMG